jgi:hypothetical protein
MWKRGGSGGCLKERVSGLPPRLVLNPIGKLSAGDVAARPLLLQAVEQAYEVVGLIVDLAHKADASKQGLQIEQLTVVALGEIVKVNQRRQAGSRERSTTVPAVFSVCALRMAHVKCVLSPGMYCGAL